MHMKTRHIILAVLASSAIAAHGQVEPAATRPSLPITGDLQYTLLYSQSAEFASNNSLGNWQTASASGNLNYTNGKVRHPLAIEYSGGYTWTIQGPAYASGFFQHGLVSQGYTWHKWAAAVTDDISYRPEAPTVGFSGVPGTGGTVGTPNNPSSQTILTVNTHTVNNLLKGEATHTLDYATGMSFGGGWEILRYPNNDGVNTDTLMANAAIARRLNARNSLEASYQFSQFKYPDSEPAGVSGSAVIPGFTFVTHSALFGVKRQWSPRISSDASAGPLFTSTDNSQVVPSILGLAANAVVSYGYRYTTADFSYNHGINGGGGYLPGGKVDDFYADFSRQFGRQFSIGLTGSYMRTGSLQGNGVTTAKFGGLELTRRLGRFINIFGNYTAIEQSSSSGLAPNTLSGLLQVIGGGIGYSPRESHLRK